MNGAVAVCGDQIIGGVLVDLFDPLHGVRSEQDRGPVRIDRGVVNPNIPGIQARIVMAEIAARSLAIIVINLPPRPIVGVVGHDIGCAIDEGEELADCGCIAHRMRRVIPVGVRGLTCRIIGHVSHITFCIDGEDQLPGLVIEAPRNPYVTGGFFWCGPTIHLGQRWQRGGGAFVVERGDLHHAPFGIMGVLDHRAIRRDGVGQIARRVIHHPAGAGSRAGNCVHLGRQVTQRDRIQAINLCAA